MFALMVVVWHPIMDVVLHHKPSAPLTLSVAIAKLAVVEIVWTHVELIPVDKMLSANLLIIHHAVAARQDILAIRALNATVCLVYHPTNASTMRSVV